MQFRTILLNLNMYYMAWFGGGLHSECFYYHNLITLILKLLCPCP